MSLTTPYRHVALCTSARQVGYFWTIETGRESGEMLVRVTKTGKPATLQLMKRQDEVQQVEVGSSGTCSGVGGAAAAAAAVAAEC